MATALIGFGANLGSPGEMLLQAVDAIRSYDHLRVTEVSRALTTLPVGSADHQPLYTNAAIRMETSLPPQSLLSILLEVEKRFGRVRDPQNPERWVSRSIDLDLLLFDDQVIDQPGMVIPHPRMSFRRFVLQPASEIGSEMIHPVARVSIASLLQKIEKKNFFILLAIGKNFDPLDLAQKLIQARSEFDFQIVVAALAKENIDEFQKPVLAEPGTKQKIRICFVDSENEFENLKELAQLVVVLFSNHDRNPSAAWLQTARNFAGPSLSIDLARNDDDNPLEIERELIAACQAMMPVATGFNVG